MKTRTMYLFAIALLAFVFSFTSNAQELGTTGLYRHTTNSGSGGAATPEEATDSVTVNGVMSYWVMPDQNISPSYNDPSDALGDLNSSFDWSATSGTPTLVDLTAGYAGANNSNYVSLEWGATGAKTVSVTEVANSGSCSAAAARTMGVLVIAAPTVYFGDDTGLEDVCATGTDGSLNPSVSDVGVSFTSEVAGARDMKLTYDLAGPAGFSAVSDHEVSIDEGAGSFTVAQTLTHYGTYTLTLKGATDRISVKSGITGGLGTGTVYTINIVPTPTTGEIYHVPNN